MACTSAAGAHINLQSLFLEGLATADRNRILAAAHTRQLFANTVVAHQGSPADYLFLLTKGHARFFFITEDGRKIILHWLATGEIFGGIVLSARPSTYLVSTEMVRDGCVLAWDRRTIRGLALRYPALWENTIAAGADYLTFYLAAHVALTCQDARQRVAHILITLAQGIGQKVSDGVMLTATNEELASAANTTLFTVSRLMSEWQRQGTLRKSRGRLLLRSPATLLQAVA